MAFVGTRSMFERSGLRGRRHHGGDGEQDAPAHDAPHAHGVSDRMAHDPNRHTRDWVPAAPRRPAPLVARPSPVPPTRCDCSPASRARTHRSPPTPSRCAHATPRMPVCWPRSPAGGWVRTHVLRPTWHHVAPEDLRWIQALTGAEGRGRHGRDVTDSSGITPEVKDRGIELLRELLADGRAHDPQGARAGVRGTPGCPGPGETMAHQLMTAEVRSVICSGPPRGSEHTYVLVDDVIPRRPTRTGGRASRPLRRADPPVLRRARTRLRARPAAVERPHPHRDPFCHSRAHDLAVAAVHPPARVGRVPRRDPVVRPVGVARARHASTRHTCCRRSTRRR